MLTNYIQLGLGELQAGDIVFVRDPNKSLRQEDDSPEVYLAMPYVCNLPSFEHSVLNLAV